VVSFSQLLDLPSGFLQPNFSTASAVAKSLDGGD